MKKCPFCSPEIGSISFLSSENFLAIYNRSPILPGHSLVIPKMHYSSLLELPQQLAQEMTLFSIEAAKLLMKAFDADAFDWTIQDGASAGQTVQHMHLHIIPRKKGDLPNPGDWFQELEGGKIKAIDSENRKNLTEKEMIEIIGMIREFRDKQ